MRILAACAAGLVLLMAGAASADENTWYMGGAEAQRTFESGRVACHEGAWAAMKMEDNTYNYGFMWGICLGAALERLDDREGVSYGAIVYGYVGDDNYYGMAWNFEHPDGAHRGAHEECAAQGPSNCILRHVVRNGCIALARGYDQHGFGSGATMAGAEEAALWDCADASTCRVTMAECSSARH